MDGGVPSVQGPLTDAAAPLVSIGLPVYNGEKFLDRALQSLRAQAYPNLEIIISDNGSSDRTLEICERHAAEDFRITLLKQIENQGPHANFEAVLERSRGDYFMWSADDDVWLPSFVSRLVNALQERPDACAAMCATERVHEDGSPIDVIRFHNDKNILSDSAIVRGLALCLPRKYNMFIYALYRAPILKRGVKFFPRALGGDRMFVSQFAVAAPLAYVDEVHYVRTHRTDHERTYQAEAARLATKLNQLWAYTRMLASSPVVPAGMKFAIPLLSASYLTFLFRKELYDAKAHLKTRVAMIITFIKRLLEPIFVGAALLVVAALFATNPPPPALMQNSTVYWLAVSLGASAIAFALAKAVRLYFGIRSIERNTKAGLRELSKLSARLGSLKSPPPEVQQDQKQTERLRDSLEAIGQAQRQLEALLRASVERQAYVADGFARSEEQRRESRVLLQALKDALTEIQKHARYSTDLLLSPPDNVDDTLRRESWSYGLNLQNTIRQQVAFAQALEASNIRELYLQQIFSGIERVALPIGAINELSGHQNKVDLLYVCAVAAHRKAKSIFEFGTYQGRTTYHLALANNDVHVTTLDMPPKPDWAYAKYNGIYFRDTEQASRISQLFQDSRDLDTTPHREKYDFVFVDADHTYEGVKNDTLKAFEMLKPGGAIMWHDYAPKSAGLVKFFVEFTKSRPLFRIKGTCLLLHIDGVDPMSFEPNALMASLEADALGDDPHNVANVYHH